MLQPLAFGEDGEGEQGLELNEDWGGLADHVTALVAEIRFRTRCVTLIGSSAIMNIFHHYRTLQTNSLLLDRR